MNTLIPQDKKYVLKLLNAGYYLCPYCGRVLFEPSLTNLQCQKCKTYIVWDEKENRPRLPIFKN